jgi:hypothetical protein
MVSIDAHGGDAGVATTATSPVMSSRTADRTTSMSAASSSTPTCRVALRREWRHHDAIGIDPLRRLRR